MDAITWLAAALGPEAAAAGVLSTDPAELDALRTDRSGWHLPGQAPRSS